MALGQTKIIFILPMFEKEADFKEEDIFSYHQGYFIKLVLVSYFLKRTRTSKWEFKIIKSDVALFCLHLLSQVQNEDTNGN